MAKIRIDLRKPYTGEYDFNIEDEPFTNLEWRWIKKISEYMPATVMDGWAGMDPDLFIAFAVVALVRAGKVGRDAAVAFAEEFDDIQAGVRMLFDDADKEQEDDDGPPEVAAAVIDVLPPRSTGGSSGETSESPAGDLSLTGALV
jgi:hypothetical protein